VRWSQGRLKNICINTMRYKITQNERNGDDDRSREIGATDRAAVIFVLLSYVRPWYISCVMRSVSAGIGLRKLCCNMGGVGQKSSILLTCVLYSHNAKHITFSTLERLSDLYLFAYYHSPRCRSFFLKAFRATITSDSITTV
jgi:hypothetical protein